MVVKMLSDSPDIEAAAYGDEEIPANAAGGLLYIGMSSSQRQTGVALFEAGHEQGARVLDALGIPLPSRTSSDPAHACAATARI